MSANTLQVVPYEEDMLEEILTLFYQTVHTVCRKDYTLRQLDVWAPRHPLKGAWEKKLAESWVRVARMENKIVGFCNLQEKNCYFDCLYVHKDYQGRGVASALVKKLELRAIEAKISKLTVDASATALPFFKQKGYHMLKKQTVVREGEELTNYVMEKTLLPKRKPF
jgi:putative acetyltransferase